METVFSSPTASISKLMSFTVLLFILFSCSTFTSTNAYDALDPTGNITIKWDIISWTPDGYVVSVTETPFRIMFQKAKDLPSKSN